MANVVHHYSVIVYCDDGRQERYLFRDVHDIEMSIRTTWSKVMDSITVTRDDKLTGQAIRVNDKHTGKMLMDCFHILPSDILDGPTHF